MENKELEVDLRMEMKGWYGGFIATTGEPRPMFMFTLVPNRPGVALRHIVTRPEAAAPLKWAAGAAAIMDKRHAA